MAPRKAAEGGLDHALGLGANGAPLTAEELALAGKGEAGGGGSKEVAALHSLVTQQQKMLEQLLMEQRDLKATVLEHKKSVDQQGASVERLTANANLSTAGSSEASRATSPAVLRIEMPQQNNGRHSSGGGHRRSSGHSSRHSSHHGSSHHGQSEPGVQRANSMERRGSSRDSGRPHRGSQMGHGMGFLHSAQNAAGTTASAGTSLSSDAGSLPPTPLPSNSAASAGWSRVSPAGPDKHLSHV